MSPSQRLDAENMRREIMAAIDDLVVESGDNFSGFSAAEISERMGVSLGAPSAGSVAQYLRGMEKDGIVADSYASSGKKRRWCLRARKMEAAPYDFGSSYVEALPHWNGGGWVATTAQVSDDAYVGPDACVYGHAQVKGNAIIAGSARIYDEASVLGNAVVAGDAEVGGMARVSSRARVLGGAKIIDSADVAGSAWVGHEAVISGGAVVEGAARVSGRATVTDDAVVSGASVIDEDASISGRARIEDQAHVRHEAVVKDRAVVYGSAAVLERAQVVGDYHFGEGLLGGDEILGELDGGLGPAAVAAIGEMLDLNPVTF